MPFGHWSVDFLKENVLKNFEEGAAKAVRFSRNQNYVRIKADAKNPLRYVGHYANTVAEADKIRKEQYGE